VKAIVPDAPYAERLPLFAKSLPEAITVYIGA